MRSSGPPRSSGCPCIGSRRRSLLITATLMVDVTDGTATCGGIHHQLDVENVVTVR
jgi:hypothetical protein